MQTEHLADRHQATRDIARWFDHAHLPEHLQAVSKECHDLAEKMIHALPDSPQLHHGLQRLLEAKDAFVRAAMHSKKEH